MSESVIVKRPAFSEIDIGSVEAELDKKLSACRVVIENVAKVKNPEWSTLVQPVAEAHNELNLFWSPVRHLNSVMNNDQLRDVFKQCLPKLSSYYTDLGQHKPLYEATLALKSSDAYDKLTPAQQREIQNELRDFELGGVSLTDDAKKRFAEIAQDLSRLTTEFSDNVLDATNAWEKQLDDVAALKGLPESAIAAARQRAEQKDLDGYLVNLEFPSYLAVMTYAEDATLRKELYTAFTTRASNQGPHAGQYDNSATMKEILQLRAEKANLLGYDAYADLSMVRKMVESPQVVVEFLDDLAKRAVPQAREEFETLEGFAKSELGMDALEAWDVPYVSDKLKQREHELSAEDLKPYFPASIAVPGMFKVVGKLFGLSIDVVENVDVYHEDVALFQIKDANGELRGEFFMDNYARANKRGGAWMDVCSSRQKISGQMQTPIAYLTCNLTPPVGDDPALLTHDEVTTLFHEFGHGLHHMLTRVDNAGVSGINGVEWDAVELPSQFLENWCWERESIDMISGHYKTGEKLPDELLERMRNARNFQSAMQLVRQLEFAMFDMQLHIQSTPTESADIQATLNKVREKVAVVPTPSFNRFQHGFSHIFSGGYSAGYFSYKWAEVLSADAFARFEEEGIFNEKTGRDFLKSVLEVGGSRDAMTSFVEFRGREPTVDALLRHSGLAA